jgi:hypothetical protein
MVRPLLILRRVASWAMVVVGLALVVLSFHRAATFPFTHDESLSYASFTWEPRWGGTTNNHFLNTFLMRCGAVVFGPSELALRLPNVLAHAAYLAGVLLVLGRVRSVIVALAGFALLALNPFQLDFFFLARGYGLAAAFLMLGLHFMLRSHESKPEGRVTGGAMLAVASGALAVLASFVLLEYFIPLVVAVIWVLLTDPSLRRFRRERLPAAFGLVAASTLVVGWNLVKAFAYRDSGQLYWGGSGGFIGDTVEGLARCSLYDVMRAAWAPSFVVACVVAAFALLVVLAAYRVFVRREASGFELAGFVLAGAVALPVLQHALVHANFPIERAALFYVPLFGVALTLGLDRVERLVDRLSLRLAVLVPAAVLAIVLGVHAGRCVATRVCNDWWYEAHNEEAIEAVAREHTTQGVGRLLTLGDSWLLEPSLNFYRVTRGYSWLAPVTRAPLQAADYDYIYAFARDVDERTARRYVTVVAFPDTGTVLLRRERGPVR